MGVFPSPIYGASFKLEDVIEHLPRYASFRPLYTGLVSNNGLVSTNMVVVYEGFRPLYTGLVSN